MVSITSLCQAEQSASEVESLLLMFVGSGADLHCFLHLGFLRNCDLFGILSTLPTGADACLASFVSDTFWFASDLPGRNAPYIPGRATVIQLWEPTYSPVANLSLRDRFAKVSLYSHGRGRLGIYQSKKFFEFFSRALNRLCDGEF